MKKYKMIQKMKVVQVKAALTRALEDAWQSEIVDTKSFEDTIGPENEYADKEDWMEWRLGDWISEEE